MEAKHTPGPWTTDDIDQSDFYRYVIGENKIVCRVRLKGFMGNKLEHAEANARLIAAAPDLLDSLSEIFDYAGGADSALHDEYVMDRARAAIAKAEGK